MMDLIEKTLVELDREVTTILVYLQRWWGGMSEAGQLYFIGVCGAALLLLGLRRPSRRRYNSYREGGTMGLAQQFLFASVVLMVFTFGLDILFNASSFSFFGN